MNLTEMTVEQLEARQAEIAGMSTEEVATEELEELKDELPRLVDSQYTTGEEWRNSTRNNEEAEPKHKQHPVVDMSGGESEV